MSSPPEKEKDKEKDVKENPPKESADPEPPKVKIEEKKSTNEIAKDSKEEEEKKMKRTQRFGMLEKKGSNLIMSSQEELDKRKERFKEQIKEEEEKEKEKEKDKEERERSRDKNNNTLFCKKSTIPMVMHINSPLSNFLYEVIRIRHPKIIPLIIRRNTCKPKIRNRGYGLIFPIVTL